MKGYLLIDFGSTYTKLTAVDIENEEIAATAKDITTVDTDIMIGFNKACDKINSILKEKNIEIDYIKKLACSSAAGGLKMVAIGLVPDLTSEAAKRAALGAGARVLKVYSFQLSQREVEEIKNSNLDIILLAGGTDGGNQECIIHNAKMLRDAGIELPVVVAGNKSAADQVEDILKDGNIYYRVCDNVMPSLNHLNVEPAREIIRDIFMEKIVEAKGMSTAESYINGILMPTPAAVLNAGKALSEGSEEEDGISDLIILDIGGATTDVHSLAYGEPSRSGVTLRGLEEPYAKRTVEGDLGMRYSTLSLLEACGKRKIKKYLSKKERDIEKECERRHRDIRMVPQNEEDTDFDEAMAKAATEVSMERHVGFIENTYTPTGVLFTQTGKDLTKVKYLIGTGGVLVHSDNPKAILKAGLFNIEQPNYLKPEQPKLLLDKYYILSAMGLLAEEDKNLAIRLMKKYLVEV
ncbi:MAG: methylaspartate mutase accessory protein GlmL [Clostridiaceae bacterium]